jgi:hypothetical protein
VFTPGGHLYVACVGAPDGCQVCLVEAGDPGEAELDSAGNAAAAHMTLLPTHNVDGVPLVSVWRRTPRCCVRQHRTMPGACVLQRLYAFCVRCVSAARSADVAWTWRAPRAQISLGWAPPPRPGMWRAARQATLTHCARPRPSHACIEPRLSLLTVSMETSDALFSSPAAVLRRGLAVQIHRGAHQRIARGR